MDKLPLVSVVDDSDSVRESLPDLLRHVGLAALAFPSAEAFLASEAAEDTTCLILDVKLPGMSGPDLHRELVRRGRTIPVVFINVGDPVASGLVNNVPRPDGNATGITSLFQSLGAKWVDLLKEAAPRIERAALVFVPENVNNQYFGVINAAAKKRAVETVPIPYRNLAELEGGIHTFAAEPNGALLMVPPPPSPAAGELINRLALKHRLPTMYSAKYYVVKGGMMSYGSSMVESYERAAAYIDRILRGAKVNELPVQFPTKAEFAINLKTAEMIGLKLPKSIVALASDVIE